MPEVVAFAAAGRTTEQKRGLVKDITEAFVKNFGVPLEVVTIQIVESPADSKAAPRSPPLSEPKCRKFFRPRATARKAHSAALLLISTAPFKQGRPSEYAASSADQSAVRNRVISAASAAGSSSIIM